MNEPTVFSLIQRTLRERVDHFEEHILNGGAEDMTAYRSAVEARRELLRVVQDVKDLEARFME